MNWEAIGAIGEVVGALGVIVSLLYLALQIRQNSNVTRSATRQAISTTQVDMGLRVAESPDLLASLAEWWGSDDATTPLKDTEIRGYMLRRAFLRAFENQYHQYKDGLSMSECGTGIARL